MLHHTTSSYIRVYSEEPSPRPLPPLPPFPHTLFFQVVHGASTLVRFILRLDDLGEIYTAVTAKGPDEGAVDQDQPWGTLAEHGKCVELAKSGDDLRGTGERSSRQDVSKVWVGREKGVTVEVLPCRTCRRSAWDGRKG